MKVVSDQYVVDSKGRKKAVIVAAKRYEQIMEDLEGGVSSLWLGLGEGRIPVESLPDVLAETYLDLGSNGGWQLNT